MINFPAQPRAENPCDPWAPDPKLKDAYWSVVEDCLKEFHGFDPLQAQRQAGSLRQQIESPPPGISGELIYHDEPFYVACEIAGTHDASAQDHLLQRNRARYDALLALHRW